MKEYHKDVPVEEAIYMGLDVHRRTWHLTVRTAATEIQKVSMLAELTELQKVIDRYGATRTAVAYKAGYFGFGLRDRITAQGARCLVTPPSLLPQESGNRVKTDKKDSAKLARLAKGELKAVHVPSVEERNHRQLLRQRGQTIKARTRVQLQIKAFLMFHGIPCPPCSGKWSNLFFNQLQALDVGDAYLQSCFTLMLEQYQSFNRQVLQATRTLRQLAAHPTYRERYRLLRTVPGVGLITAMQVLLELQDVSRFSSAEKLAAGCPLGGWA
jgi:transposase